MKTVNSKPYINISHLIDNYHSSKKHSLNLTRPGSQQSNYQCKSSAKQNHFGRINKQEKSKHVCLKLSSQNQMLSSYSLTQREKEARVVKLDEKCKKAASKADESKQHFKHLQKLITSNKMFINPDKWQQFLESCKSDPNFHKALSSFLYTYFIQNYQR